MWACRCRRASVCIIAAVDLPCALWGLCIPWLAQGCVCVHVPFAVEHCCGCAMLLVLVSGHALRAPLVFLPVVILVLSMHAAACAAGLQWWGSLTAAIGVVAVGGRCM